MSLKQDRKKNTAASVLRVLAIVLYGVGLLVCIEDIFSVYFHPEEYENLFGSESTGHLWSYKSQSHYIFTGFLWFFWFALGIFFSLNRKVFRSNTWSDSHLVLTVGYLLYCMVSTAFE